MAKKYKHQTMFTFEDKRYVVRADNLEELYEKKAKKIAELEKGQVILRQLTVRQWSDEWMRVYKDKSLSYKKYKDYEGRLNNHVLPVIGSTQLRYITSADCQAVVNRMDGYSKDYISKICNLMQQMFKKAISNRLLLFNPAEDLELPVTAVDNTGRALTEYEREVFLKTAEYSKYGIWAKTMLYCGCRPGETARIRICDVNYESSLLYIDGTKTKAAKRTVPLPPELLEAFAKVKGEPFDHIFRTEDGRPLQHSSTSRRWKYFWNEMNLEAGTQTFRNQLKEPYIIPKDCIAYCCRHSFATDLKDALMPDHIMRHLMGHSNKSVTDRYVGITKREFEIAEELLGVYRGYKEATDIYNMLKAVNFALNTDSPLVVDNRKRSPSGH
ncbi:MAG: tyrosine-type recombinase/integrase [Anaerovoracaceae bacterium]